MKAILRKELADYFTSIRFVVLFALVLLMSAVGLVAAYQGIRGMSLPEGFIFLGLYTASGEVIPSVVAFVALLVPIIGIALGFDAINSERSGGTLSRLVAQPIYRDNVINGKFLAGVVTLMVMIGTMVLIVGGYGLKMIGVAPNPEEIIRLFIYVVLVVIYGAFWMGLAMLFSVLFRKVAASLLTALVVWLFFSFFIILIAPAVANAIAPTPTGSQAELLRNAQVQQMAMRFSPSVLFSEATTALLVPVVAGSLGVITMSQVSLLIPNPLSLSQSLTLIWPHLTSLVSLSAICFAISYVVFMRQEIRAT